MSIHLVKPDGTFYCPEALARDQMTDAEFWAHVFPDAMPDVDDYDLETEVTSQLEPCPVCGERGPCGYDAEGRPMLHTNDMDDEA